MELDENSAKENKKTCIILQHILLAIRNDEEVGRLMVGITIAHDVFCPTSTRCCSPRRPRRRHPTAGASRSSLPRRHREFIELTLCSQFEKISHNKTRIILRHILLAIRNDEELRRLQAGITIAHDVFYPTSTRVLVSKMTMEKASVGGSKEVESPKKA
ncbi:hypothetical protein EJB05_56180, partial [Eragrostis curvula]